MYLGGILSKLREKDNILRENFKNLNVVAQKKPKLMSGEFA